MRRYGGWFIFLFIFISCNQTQQPKLIIATAANMQFAMEAMTEAFHEQTGISIETVVSSSGKLTAQIKAGAPYDIFVSADMKYPNTLFEEGFSLKEPQVYAYGKLILWSRNDDFRPTIELLTNPKIKHIAIANPKTAPYGKATISVLQYYQIYDLVKEKLVFGESISQTNQFIATGAAELGFTAKSLVSAPEMKNQGVWTEIDKTSYTPINQGVIILKNEKNNLSEAQAFYDFLFSEKGKNILNTFGYETND